MHRLTKPLVVATLAIGLVGGMASVGSASVSADKKSFCKAALKIQVDAAEGEVPTVTEDVAASLEKQFRKVAKKAPTKALKNASNTIADWYGEIADGNSATDISTEEGEAYGEAAAKFYSYLGTKCLTEAIPDITLPGGGKVDIPGLGD